MKKKLELTLENTYIDLPAIFYEKLEPKSVSNPNYVIYNQGLGHELGFNQEEMMGQEGLSLLSGKNFIEGITPIAQSYAGHQFGQLSMLGDGRSMLLGERITPKKERVDIQLKGAGKTAYSRGGDGRAALGPMLREYIISEAMHGLGIPTSRSLAVVTTGDLIQRETKLKSAVLTRVATSHIRVGTFQFAARFGELQDLIALTDYTIERHTPHVKQDSNPYLAFLKEVIQKQAELIAQWQQAGFIHGVMNTDNMTISGETIDYGPCAFMDGYHQETVFSSIDIQGRYAFRNQPSIAAWNLARFAETLLPLLGESKEEALYHAQSAISEFGKLYQEEWMKGMRGKLGLFHEEREDATLIEELLSMMQHYHADYTNTFLALTYDDDEDFPMGKMEDFKEWKKKWQQRLAKQEESSDEINERMLKYNPALIPRNRWVEEAIERAVQQADNSAVQTLVTLLESPYTHTNKQKEFAKRDFMTDTTFQTFCGT